jgi:hypothetical protein
MREAHGTEPSNAATVIAMCEERGEVSTEARRMPGSPYRVAVCGPGPMAQAAIREIIRLPETELVAVLRYNMENDDADVRRLIGGPPTGLMRTICDWKAGEVGADGESFGSEFYKFTAPLINPFGRRPLARRRIPIHSSALQPASDRRDTRNRAGSSASGKSLGKRSAMASAAKSSCCSRSSGVRSIRSTAAARTSNRSLT